MDSGAMNLEELNTEIQASLMRLLTGTATVRCLFLQNHETHRITAVFKGRRYVFQKPRVALGYDEMKSYHAAIAARNPA
jgi:hypothetical protein